MELKETRQRMGRAGLSQKQTTKMETQVRLVVMRIDEISRIILVYHRKERGSYRKLGSLWSITYCEVINGRLAEAEHIHIIVCASGDGMSCTS